MNNLNLEKIKYLRSISKRTLKILDLIEQGNGMKEILEKTKNDEIRVERSLVDHYIKVTRLTKDL